MIEAIEATKTHDSVQQRVLMVGGGDKTLTHTMEPLGYMNSGC